MNKQLIGGVWILTCDWKNPETGKLCDLGRDDNGDPNGEPLMAIDPDGGRNPEKHFQCGRHHGIIPQAEREEFQIPEGHKLFQDEIVVDSGGKLK